VFEHSSQPIISLRAFLSRLATSIGIGSVLIAASLLIGMVGYHTLEKLSWVDAFLNEAMLHGGMGPVNAPVTFPGKLFAGVLLALLRPARYIGNWHYPSADCASHPALVPRSAEQVVSVTGALFLQRVAQHQF